MKNGKAKSDKAAGKYGSPYLPNNKKGNQQYQNIYNYKLILLGDIAVGKTSILNRYIKNEFQTNYQCTINTEYKLAKLRINSTTMADLQIWDTCGEEKYYAITRQYYHNCNGVILVFDLNNYASLEKVSQWLKDVKEYISKSTIISIVGNKEDIANRPPNVESTAKDFAKKNRLEYYKVSAMTGNGVAKVFETIVTHLIRGENLNLNKDLNKTVDSEENQHGYHSKTVSLDKSKTSKLTNEEREGCC